MSLQTDIYLGQKRVGVATLTGEGLYYKIQCRCNLPEGKMHRICLLCAGEEIPLGICVPVGGAFGLDTKVPIKRFQSRRISARVEPVNVGKGKFYRLEQGKPIPFLKKLSTAQLSIQDGQIGVCIY